MWRNGSRDVKRPLNKGQGHSFWYHIDFSYTTSRRLSIVTFALGRTVYPHYIPFKQRDGRQTDRRINTEAQAHGRLKTVSVSTITVTCVAQIRITCSDCMQDIERKSSALLTWWRTTRDRWYWDASADYWRLPREMWLPSRYGRKCQVPRHSASRPRQGAPVAQQAILSTWIACHPLSWPPSVTLRTAISLRYLIVIKSIVGTGYP